MHDLTYDVYGSDEDLNKMVEDIYGDWKMSDVFIVTSYYGVRYNKEKSRFELYYNPDFIKNLSDDEVVGILMHEFYHIILLHLYF